MLRFIGLIFCILPLLLQSQPLSELSLPVAYQLAKDHYPLLKNKALLAQITDLKLQNLEKSRLPTISWNANASLQSETIEFPSDTPVPISIDLPLYNVKTYAEAQYLIYDGGINAARQQIEKTQLEADLQSIEVELNRLKQQVNQYFVGTLLLRKQIQLLEVTLDDLEIRKETVEAGVRHGVLLESEVDRISVRELEIKAEIEKLKDEIKAMITVLADLTGTEIAENASLILPEMDDFQLNQNIDRPEQTLFQLKKQSLLANESMITAQRKPKVSAFARAGVGYPNPLNFFETSVAPYAIGGVAFTWDLFDWGQRDRDRQLLTVQSQLIDNQQATFEFNINLQEGKVREEIAKTEKLIETDRAIAALQNKILKQLAVQLENGVIVSSDYLTQSNAELKARQQLQIHEIQLLHIKIDYLTQKGLL